MGESGEGRYDEEGASNALVLLQVVEHGYGLGRLAQTLRGGVGDGGMREVGGER